MGLKQARSCFVFPREFSSLFRVSRVQLGSFGCSRVETWDGCVTSSGKLSSQSLTSWLRYGFGTVLDPLRWLVSLRESSGAGFQVSLARVWARRVQERPRVARGKRRECAPLARCLFNCPVWTPPTGGWSNQIVRMGRSSTHVHGFLARHFRWRKE